MPSKVEKDAVTGTETTGHEWDGIKELNTPLPKWWLYVFYATIVWAVAYWILFPAIPYGTDATDGLLDYNPRVELEQRMALARTAQAAYLDRIEAAPLDEIRADPDLLQFALAGGATAFADNCAGCHGLGGAGQLIYPTLADDDWLWGGSLDDIYHTIAYGVRQEHEQTRFNEMPAFGEILERPDIVALGNFVLSLAGAAPDPEAAERGAAIYQEQGCAGCHGELGEGVRELGGPRLDDQIWLYGGDLKSVTAQISMPRHGVMPGWIDRLDPALLKMLAVYVHGLGGGE